MRESQYSLYGVQSHLDINLVRGRILSAPMIGRCEGEARVARGQDGSLRRDAFQAAGISLSDLSEYITPQSLVVLPLSLQQGRYSQTSLDPHRTLRWTAQGTGYQELWL